MSRTNLCDAMIWIALVALAAFAVACLTGCRTAGPVARISDSPYAQVTVGETTIEAAQGKTVSTDAANPMVRDNAVPVYSSGSATTTREGDSGAPRMLSPVPLKEVAPAVSGGG